MIPNENEPITKKMAIDPIQRLINELAEMREGILAGRPISDLEKDDLAIVGTCAAIKSKLHELRHRIEML